MKLARRCQERLQQAEVRVTKLQKAFSEGMEALREEGEEYLPAEPDEGEDVSQQEELRLE